MAKTITIAADEYERLKQQASIDKTFLKELVQSISDIKAGRVRQVR